MCVLCKINRLLPKKVQMCQEVWNCSCKLLDFATLYSHVLQCKSHHYNSSTLLPIFICMSDMWKLAERLKSQQTKGWEEDMVTKVGFSSRRLNSPEFHCGQRRKINIPKGQCSKLSSCSETFSISQRNSPPPAN